MKSMKKILSLLLSVMLVAALFCMPASAWEAQTTDVDLRIGFLNDTHITKAGSGEALAISAMETLKTLGAEKLAFVGDNVYYNSKNDDPLTDIGGYEKLYAGITAAGWAKEDVIAYAMGNHEFPQANTDETVSENSIKVFTEQTGFDLNHHVVQNGFHFIAGGAKDYNGAVTAETESYLMAEIDKALAEDSTNDVDGVFANGVIPDSTKPVFLLLHHPIKNTVTGSNSKYTDEFRAYLDNRPQIVNITAHMHLLAQQPEIIWQGGFTAFQSPMTAGGYQSQKGCVNEGNITDQMCSQGSFAEVKDNVVYLYRLDYTNGTFIGEPFVVDIPAIVADRLDDDATNDTASMNYTAEKRAQVTTTAEFPEDAELKATAVGNNIIVTYPNSAYIVGADEIQQDNFLRAYKLEVVDKSGTVHASQNFQADFWKAEANRATSYTKEITGLSYGEEYTVNVYPMTPFGSFGTPISATVTTEEQVIDSNALRFEFEKFCPTSKLIASSPYVSNSQFVISAQTAPYATLNRGDVLDENGEQKNPYTFSFPVDLPVDDTYKIDYTVNHHGAAGNFVSDIIIKVDGVQIGTNGKNFTDDLSRGGTFPWNNNIPLARYAGTPQTLTKGEHTVTVEVYHPTNTSQVQPFLFCMDYIEFTPSKLILKSGESDRAEFEDYIVPYTLNDGTTYTPPIWNGELSSGGKYAAIDSADGKASDDYIMTIPVSIEKAGKFAMEYVSLSIVSKMDIYLDNIEGEPLNSNISNVFIDEKNADGKFRVFSSSWAGAVKFSKNIELPEGDHELLFVIHPRKTEGDIALFLDYIQFTSLTKKISGSTTTIIEAEELAGSFYYNDADKTPYAPEVKVSPNASGSKFIQMDTVHKENHPAIRADIDVSVERPGIYELEYVISDVGSPTNIYVDGLLVNEVFAWEKLDEEKNAEGKYGYFNDLYHSARRDTVSVELTEGEHEITVEFGPRPEQGVLDVAVSMDYLKLTPPGIPTITADGVTTIEFDDITSAKVREEAAASEGKIVCNNWDSNKPDIGTNVIVKESGYYDISYVVGERSVTQLGETSKDRLYLSLITLTLGEVTIGTNDGEYTKILTEYGVWTTAPMSLYEKKSVWLDAGEYQLNADVGVTKDNKFKYQLDYISFAPAGYVAPEPVEGVVVKNGVATATALYDTPVSGTAVLALYNGGKLLSLSSMNVTDTKEIVINAPVSGTPTDVKVFVWDYITGMKAQTAEKLLTVK
ncbi:MAG: hypothetical protein IJC78_01885 [Clostridia bacterium]|nr:hypothetical protein [Clostridia bacterium]